MKKIMGRLNDWRRERRILSLTKQAVVAYSHGACIHARKLEADRNALIGTRSPEQVERMERRMGLR